MCAENYIKTLTKYCEIVIFICNNKFYTDIVINEMKLKENVNYRLYRQHTTIIDGENTKDLSKLRRDLNKILL